MSVRPIGFETVADVGMEGKPGTGTMLLSIFRSLIILGSFENRQDPMPVQDRGIGIQACGGMPSEQMVVIGADFAGSVVMANVVEVGLRQWDVDQARDQQADPEDPSDARIDLPKPHVSTSIIVNEQAHRIDPNKGLCFPISSASSGGDETILNLGRLGSGCGLA